MSYCHEQGGFASGDRVGVLLDLDPGWLRFYHKKRRGPGDEVATSCTQHPPQPVAVAARSKGSPSPQQ